MDDPPLWAPPTAFLPPPTHADAAAAAAAAAADMRAALTARLDRLERALLAGAAGAELFRGGAGPAENYGS